MPPERTARLPTSPMTRETRPRVQATRESPGAGADADQPAGESGDASRVKERVPAAMRARAPRPGGEPRTEQRASGEGQAVAPAERQHTEGT